MYLKATQTSTNINYNYNSILVAFINWGSMHSNAGIVKLESNKDNAGQAILDYFWNYGLCEAIILYNCETIKFKEDGLPCVTNISLTLYILSINKRCRSTSLLLDVVARNELSIKLH